VGQDNVCDIGDERGWYARQAEADNPVLLDSYRKHPFYGEAMTAMQRAYGACPSLDAQGHPGSAAGCRLLHLSDEERKEVASSGPGVPLDVHVDPRVGAVLSAGAVGMFGYLLPSSVHVVDRHGLADPVTARRELGARSRPGHEKTLSAAWMLGRFSEPAPDEDASIAAVRHVLSCGLPAALLHAVQGPLTAGGFVDNVLHAWDYSRLRLPADPFVAETRFCGTPSLEHASAGGGGGARFDWRCPDGTAIHRVRGTFSRKDGAIASVRAVCGDARRELREGPAQGEGSTEPFEVACPAPGSVAGIYGTADHLVRSVGLLCSQGGVASETTAGGDPGKGSQFSLACAGGPAMVGMEGRAGALVDAIGVVCRSQ
jgi:hypothetical protein